MNCFLKTIGAFITLLFCTVAAWAQTIEGTVYDDAGQPVPGTTVENLNRKLSVASGPEGAYQIAGKPGDSLRFTHTSYTPVTIAVTGKNHNVSLVSNQGTLNDVVVVGYGTQRRGDVTVSIEKVNMADLNKAPVRSFDEALAGRVAGVQVTSSDGQPGAVSQIVVRGNNSITQDNSPLYIIDGFPIEGSNNNLLNPKDIESIEVLKDASATAIYGSRGANGVIMITTKKGKQGPPVVQLGASYGLQRAVKTIEMMTPYEFLLTEIERDPSNSASSPTTIYLTIPNRTLDYYKTVQGINWQKLVLRDAPMKDYNVSLTGGNQNTKYAVSGNITDQDGVIINSNYTRYQGRVSLDQTLGKKFKAGINANYAYTRQSGIAPSQSNNSASTNIMYSVWGYRPVEGADVNILDQLFDASVDGSNDYRVNTVLNLNNLHRVQRIKNLYSNVYLEYNILPGLKFRTTGGITLNDRVAEVFNNSNTQYGNIRSINGVNGSITFYERSTWVNENILTYSKRSRSHNFDITGVVSEQGSKYDVYGTGATQLPNESLGLKGLSQGVAQNPVTTGSTWKLLSYVGRFNYNYKSIYYLTGSFRADGSSRFKEGNRWGYFPAVSFAWRFYNEPFFKNQDILSDGKLRIGYGQNGNNRVGDFAYYSTITMPIDMSYTISNAPVRGAGPTAIGNPDLKWETTKETNIGLDLGFLRSAISLTVEAYRKRTFDLLLQADLPPSAGYSKAYKNVGSVQNEGLEFTINTKNITRHDFTWNTNFNIAFNRNKVLGLNEGQDYMLSTMPWDNLWQNVPAYITRVGQPIGQIYGYVWEGVYQLSDFTDNGSGSYTLKDNVTTNGNSRANIKPGDIKYKDINGDLVVNASDYTVIGNGNPKFQGGLNNNFTYKGFDLNIFFQWSYGNDILNANRIYFDGNAQSKANLNQYASYNNRWSMENQGSQNFRARGFFGGGYSSRYVEDGSYLRLKTVALGYTLPANVLSRAKIKAVRLYIASQNLVTWTKYSGIDPEINVYNSALTPGFDYSPYPRAKTVTLGLNLTF